MGAQDIVELLRNRDSQGLDALLRGYGPLMRYIIAPILPDPREREECVQDVALQVWEKMDSFDPARGSFPAWLTAVTRNAALNRARRQEPAHSELTADLPDPKGSPEQQLLEKERQKALNRALWELNREDRLLLYRKYYYRQSTGQIARELGTTERAVEGRLYRLKRKLRKLLGGAYDG